jgi:branched-chain amino acid transport system ATP-binding protein
MTRQSTTLRMESVHAGYGRVEVLHGISLAVAPGDLVAVLGANGAGKSTALRCLLGLTRPLNGRIFVGSRDITDEKPWLRASMGIGCVPEGRQVFAGMTVADNLRAAAWPHRHRFAGGELDRRLAEVCERFPVVGARRNEMAGLLSGGQQQMLAIARALVGRPDYLLLDEPTLGLAHDLAADVVEMTRTLADNGIGVLLLEQNARAALAVADSAVVFASGRMAYSGDPKPLLESTRLFELYTGVAAPNVVTKPSPSEELAARLARSLKGSSAERIQA